MLQLQLKSDLLKTIQISIQLFLNKKFKNGFYFFTCILPDYVAHDILKEFWKNIHFENMRAVFLWVVKTDFGEEKAYTVARTDFRFYSSKLCFFFHGWKCIILGAIHRSKFLHLWRKPAVIFSKWLIFQNCLVVSMFI